MDELISRIQGLLPAAPLVGGVTQPNAWGTNPWGGQRSLRGAVFLNQRTHDEGAVGCFMQGPLKVSDPALILSMLAVMSALAATHHIAAAAAVGTCHVPTAVAVLLHIPALSFQLLLSQYSCTLAHWVVS